MAEKFKSKANDGLNKILEELCAENETDSIEADIIALFEDIAKLFVGREEEFLNFEELSSDAKGAIYTEIKNIIALLQQLKGAANKDAVMEMLGENLVVNFATNSGKFQSISEKLGKQEQRDLKRRLADAILLALYRQRQLYEMQSKAVPKKLSSEIEKYVNQIQKSKSIESTVPKKLSSEMAKYVSQIQKAKTIDGSKHVARHNKEKELGVNIRKV